eukprot:4840514-Pleurochrysis_carterae.AAC.1
MSPPYQTLTPRQLDSAMRDPSSDVTRSHSTARRMSNATRVCLTSFGVSSETASVGQFVFGLRPRTSLVQAAPPN